MEAINGKILVVDDDADIREVLKDRLEYLGYRVSLAAYGNEGLQQVERNGLNMVFLDIQMPDMNGLDVLREIRRRGHQIPVAMITAYGSIDRAVEAMKQGAYDFITKPFNPDYIALVAEKGMERERVQREIEILSEEVGARYHLVVGKSPAMIEAVQAAKKVAASRSTVLLLGESGTGKEVFARAIHGWSDRAEKPFVAINCVGLSRDLLESELFGHERGAFTGAVELKKGKIELAHGGTVFLDEIGDISTELQTKLLRFLQEREFERVGGVKPIGVDVRIIAATSRDLAAAVLNGQFRGDLFHRLNVVPVALPPLRQRRQDIATLSCHFLRRFAAETKKHFDGVEPEAMEKLIVYDWPGNVRELANVIERALVLGNGPKLVAGDLPMKITAPLRRDDNGSFSYQRAIEDYRRDLICKTLAQVDGNCAAAARLLKLQRTYLARLIKTLGIKHRVTDPEPIS